MKKLGFIGAMNRDLVAQISGADLIKEMGLNALPLVETSVSDAVALQGVETLTKRGAQSYLGGSAFNVARVIGLLNSVEPSVSGRFFGVAGAVDEAWPHVEALNDWGIETRYVRTLDLAPATCLAMVEDGGRTLLTATGANAQVRDLLVSEKHRLAELVAECDVVHVTSFLDAQVPALLAGIVRAAKDINPELKLSLDPGAAWVFPGGDGFDELLRQSDILHLNHEELAHLTSGGREAIGAVGARLSSDSWMIVSRHHEWVAVYEGQGAQMTSLAALPECHDLIDVVDANGAGDTFGGAFLWAYLKGAGPIDAASFAFNCARAKVGVAGPVTRDILAQKALAFEFGPA